MQVTVVMVRQATCALSVKLEELIAVYLYGKSPCSTHQIHNTKDGTFNSNFISQDWSVNSLMSRKHFGQKVKLILITQIYTNGTTLVSSIIQKIIVLEVWMWQVTRQFKNGFEDCLFFGNQKQSGPFKITKDFTGWSRNKGMSSDQLHFNWEGHPGSSWEEDIFLLQNEESCSNGAEVQETFKENPKRRKSKWNDQLQLA